MSKATLISLMLSLAVLLVAPVRAEFYGMSDFDVQYTVDDSTSPPAYWLEGFTFVDHNTPLSDLVLGESAGVVNVDDGGDITSLDDFDLNSYAPRNGATPSEIQTVNFGGSPTWQDTNGDGYDFFMFEAGRNDQASKWTPSTAGEPDIDLRANGGANNNQQIGGVAFKITDLLDENGDPLTNESIIAGLQFTSPGMDPGCVCAVVGSAAAFNPDPADNATIGDSQPVMTWSAGAGMVSQKIYFSENPADVEGMADSAIVEESNQTVLIVWGLGTAYVDGLGSGTYYWRVVTIADDQTVAAGQVWTFSILPSTAHNPVPADGAILVGSDQQLSWNAGLDASMHYVYFGTDRDAVAAGTAQPLIATEPRQDPGTLQSDTTYYWRVDEFTGSALVAGEIWSFATLPAGSGGLQAEYFSDSADLDSLVVVRRVDSNIDFNWNQEAPAPIINRELFSVRWRGEIEIPATDTYTFTTRSNDGSRIYVNDQLVVNDWGAHVARDTSGTIDLEAGAYPIVVEYMQDGANANILVSWESSLIPKQPIPSVVLSAVVRAGLIAPANGAADVSQNPRLNWSAADPDAEHDLYLGDDADAVAQAATAAGGIYEGRLGETGSVVANLEPGKTYYWRVDEVIAGDPQSPIKGNIWSFTTASHLVLDDLENYTDLTPDRIFETWMDGWDDPSNGSTMGYAEPDFAAGEHFVEVGFVNGGLQSGPMQYDNTGTAIFSEATLPVTTHTDWTASDVDTLMVSYRGTAPQGDFAYDPDRDRYEITATGTGIGGAADGFRFAYKQLNGDGVITARVDSLDNTNIDAMSGVMFRNTLDAGSVFAFCGFRAGAQAMLSWRTTADTSIAGTVQEPQYPATIVLPHWFKLTRQGNTITAEHSLDGAAWEALGTPTTVTMNQQVFVGLAVSANVGAANPATTTSRVTTPTVTGILDVTGPFDTFLDVGTPTNGADDLYVMVEDIAGHTAVVINPDSPTAVQSSVWKQWAIDLQAIANQGVSLSSIKNLTIGVGSRAASAPGGAGTLFIDDIGLHKTAQ